MVLALAFAVACNSDKSEDASDDEAADDDDEIVSDGTDGADGEDAPPAHVLDGLSTVHWAVANLDDDDEDGEVDLGQRGEDDELVALFAEQGLEYLDDGQVLELGFSGKEAPIALWIEGERVLDDSSADVVTIDSSVPLAEVMFEVGDFAVDSTLGLRLLGADGEEIAATVLALHGAPLILNHHRQEALEGGAVAFSYRGYGDNEDMLDDMVDVLGGAFITPDSSSYDFDVWVQDELEFGTASVPGHSIQVTMDSIRMGRSRGLDDYPEDHFFGPDEAIGTWGSGSPTSQDSFGNLEISPPVTVDGVEYPFGRIYYGDSGRGLAPASGVQEFLARQGVQAPIELDIGWLCVGHVDEFTTFLPDPTAPRGFRFYVADIDEGYAFLESLDPSFSLPQYRSDHGYSDVGEMLDDRSLLSYNEDLQLDSIEPNIELLTAELGLTPEEIVRVPALFERSSECYGAALALIPATVNMAVWTDPNGEDADLFMPDPFFRSDLGDPSSDPFISTFAALLPAHLRTHWVDDWDVYHMGWGEVHCGTNVRRAQPLDWWTAAPHLVENAP